MSSNQLKGKLKLLCGIDNVWHECVNTQSSEDAWNKNFRKFINYFFCHLIIYSCFFFQPSFIFFAPPNITKFSYMNSSCNAYGDEYILRFPWTFFVPIYFPSITGFDYVIIIVINVSVVYDSHLKSNGMVYLSIAIVMFRKYYY